MPAARTATDSTGWTGGVALFGCDRVGRRSEAFEEPLDRAALIVGQLRGQQREAAIVLFDCCGEPSFGLGSGRNEDPLRTLNNWVDSPFPFWFGIRERAGELWDRRGGYLQAVGHRTSHSCRCRRRH